MSNETYLFYYIYALLGGQPAQRAVNCATAGPVQDATMYLQCPQEAAGSCRWKQRESLMVSRAIPLPPPGLLAAHCTALTSHFVGPTTSSQCLGRGGPLQALRRLVFAFFSPPQTWSSVCLDFKILVVYNTN